MGRASLSWGTVWLGVSIWDKRRPSGDPFPAVSRPGNNKQAGSWARAMPGQAFPLAVSFLGLATGPITAQTEDSGEPFPCWHFLLKASQVLGKIVSFSALLVNSSKAFVNTMFSGAVCPGRKGPTAGHGEL